MRATKATRATGRGSHAMHDDEYVRKVQYTRLLEMAARDKGKNLDLMVHRFKAVGRGKCIGFFSNLNMAFKEVDRVVGRLVAGPWTEVKVTGNVSYVEDLVARRTYVRMATKVSGDGYGTNYGGRAPAPAPGLEKSAEIPVGVDVRELDHWANSPESLDYESSE